MGCVRGKKDGGASHELHLKEDKKQREDCI